MKKLVKYLFAAFFTGIYMAPALAVTIPSPVTGDLLSNLSRLTSFVRPLVILTYFGVLFMGGYTLETAGSNPEKMKKGWFIILWGTVGVIVIFLAPTFVNLVGSLFGQPNLIDF